mmetsp:Transcript_10190/g.16694  ORF Transcript_10190/g.16694 Transcript_10190/m.16694 type:complete len:374 (+) Transcript_10190:149-1270(+)
MATPKPAAVKGPSSGHKGGPPQLNAFQRPSNLEQVRAELEEKRNKDLTFRPAPPRPAPNCPPRQVNMNTAAILKEDARYKKKQEKEASAIKAYESELRDASEFHRWQTNMKTLDEQKRIAEIELRRLQMALADEEAVLARLRSVEQNRAKAESIQKENGEKLEKLEQELRNHELQKKALVQSVIAARDAVSVARDAALKENRRRAEDVKAEEADIQNRISERVSQETAAKADRVMQIRAEFQAVVDRDHVRDLDPTEMAGHGLLAEMSLAETKELLAMRKAQQVDQRDLKQKEIARCKQERGDMIKGKLEFIHNMRQLSAVEKERRTQQVPEEKAMAVTLKTDGRYAELSEKLARKREARRQRQTTLLKQGRS